MSIKRNQYRAIFAVVVIVAFFIPAYNSVSAFQFLLLALGSLRNDSEITLVDLLVILLPLLLVPATALLILFQALNKRRVNSLLLCLPFFSMAFFFLIFSFDRVRQVSSFSVLNLLTEMRVGFYLAAFASLLLLFSYNRRESFNTSAGK